MQKHQVFKLFLLLLLVCAVNIWSGGLTATFKSGLIWAQVPVSIFLKQLMKSNRPLLNTSARILFILSLVFLALSCKKNTSEHPEPDPEVSKPITFELSKVDYFLNEGDGLDSTVYPMKSYELQNASNVQAQKVYFEDFDGLNEKSLFTFASLPDDLTKSLNSTPVEIQTPNQIDAHGIYAVNLGRKLTDTLQQRPYENLKPGNQVVKISPNSLVKIDRSITEYWAKVSFSAIIKNRNTGELRTVTGKWKGTLYFSSYSVVLTEKSLRL